MSRSPKLVLLIALLLILQTAVAEKTAISNVYLFRNNQLVSLDTGEIISQREPITSPEDTTDEHYFYTGQPQISSTGEKLYLLDIWGTNIRQRPTDARLIEWDHITGTQTVLYDDHFVLSFFASPNMEYIAIFYLASNGRPELCLLNIDSRFCRQITIGNLPLAQQVYWLSETEVILWAGTYDPLYLLNLETGQTKNLNIPEFSEEWFLDEFNIIPGTRTLISAALPRKDSLSYTPSLFIIEIDTGDMRPLSYEIYQQNELQRRVDKLAVSFNSGYLLYGGTYMELIDFETGEVTNQFFNPRGSLWIGADTLLIQIVDENSQLSLLQIDASTGDSTVLATGEKADGVLLSVDNACRWSAC